MNNKHEATCHEDKDGGIVWPSCGLVPWKLIVSKLDDRDLHGVIDVGETISLVVHSELKDSQSPWGLQLVGVSWGVFVWLL